MAELQHKTPRKPRRTNLRRLPGWHRTGEIFYAVGFLTEYWLICLGRKAAAAAHAARDAALYLIWLLLAPVLELGQAFCTALAGPHPLRQLVPWLAPCAAGVILWAVVAHGLNLHFTLQVEVNGTVVGSVATEQNFDTARADLQARLTAARQLADSDTAALPVLEPGKLVMEVKFTEYLPQIVRDILPPRAQELTAVSKYVLCCDKTAYRHGFEYWNET